jgi:plastocyanin
VTWDFVSRQSHAVAVQSGPERFATPARNGAQLTKTFTKPGTYQIVCELHAPGMRMTVVVD